MGRADRLEYWLCLGCYLTLFEGVDCKFDQYQGTFLQTKKKKQKGKAKRPKVVSRDAHLIAESSQKRASPIYSNGVNTLIAAV